MSSQSAVPWRDHCLVAVLNNGESSASKLTSLPGGTTQLQLLTASSWHNDECRLQPPNEDWLTDWLAADPLYIASEQIT
jgi:hypothetical protein